MREVTITFLFNDAPNTAEEKDAFADFLARHIKQAESRYEHQVIRGIVKSGGPRRFYPHAIVLPSNSHKVIRASGNSGPGDESTGIFDRVGGNEP